jgi:hypothetical protein
VIAGQREVEERASRENHFLEYGECLEPWTQKEEIDHQETTNYCQ